MRYRFQFVLSIFLLSYLWISVGWAQPTPTPKQKPTPTKTDSKKSLADNENPEKIGTRNINKGQIDFYSYEKEVAMGQRLAAEVDKQVKFVDDPIITEYINRIGQNIVLHSDAKVPFTIKVVDSDEVNAFALPGGFFYVNRGLITAADNEAELAGVMAHEIGHVAARHAMEQQSKGTLVKGLMIPAIIFSGGLATPISVASQILLPITFLKFSRGMESEADRLGAQYAWATGYDPRCLLSFFEKIEQSEKKKPGGISKLFQSHPPTEDRAKVLAILIDRFPEREEYIISTSEFDLVKARLVAIVGAKAAKANPSNPANGNGTGNRPTLKRRHDPGDTQDTSPSADTTDPNQPSPGMGKDKPTLKRRDPEPPQEPDPNAPKDDDKDQKKDNVDIPPPNL